MLNRRLGVASITQANSYIRRSEAVIHNRNIIFSRSVMTWNRKFGNSLCQLIHSPSTRRYSVTENYSLVTTASLHSPFGMGIIGKNNFLSFRDVVSSMLSLVCVPRKTTRLLSFRERTLTREMTLDQSNSSSILSWAIWLVKRTFQPSLLKKKRQCGYMKRQQSVGGRRILKRRRKKGRKRLFGA